MKLNRIFVRYLVIAIVCCFIAGLAIYVYLPQAPKPITQTEYKPAERVIKTEVKDVIVYYGESWPYQLLVNPIMLSLLQ